MMQRLNQAGDTLVEVVFATAIISITLVSAFNIANNSYRIGVQSRERIEAANIVQEQAELLRAWRHQNEANDLPQVVPNPGSGFMVKRIGSVFSSISCAAAPSGCAVGVANRYLLSISRVSTGTNFPLPSGGPDGVRYTITVTWTQIGGHGLDNTQVSTTLVDRRSDRSNIDCDEVEKCS